MMQVVTYDIEDDRVRGRIAGLLEGYGRRVQESVFECRLDGPALEELISRLKRELKNPAFGQIRVYRVCESCLRASVGIGRIEAVDTSPCYIV